MTEIQQRANLEATSIDDIAHKTYHFPSMTQDPFETLFDKFYNEDE